MAARLTPEQHQARVDLYSEGLLDRQIAEQAGVSQAAITRWRNSAGLPPHGRANPSKGKPRGPRKPKAA